MRVGLATSPLAEKPPSFRDVAEGFGEEHGLGDLNGDPLDDLHGASPLPGLLRRRATSLAQWGQEAMLGVREGTGRNRNGAISHCG